MLLKLLAESYFCGDIQQRKWKFSKRLKFSDPHFCDFVLQIYARYCTTFTFGSCEIKLLESSKRLRTQTSLLPCVNTERFKASFINRLYFKYTFTFLTNYITCKYRYAFILVYSLKTLKTLKRYDL